MGSVLDIADSSMACIDCNGPEQRWGQHPLLALASMPLNRLARAFLFACLRSPIAHFELLLLPNSHLLDVIRM
jgi:hypothetical protein